MRVAINENMALDMMGETLFPIILKLCQTVGWNRKSSGKP